MRKAILTLIVFATCLVGYGQDSESGVIVSSGGSSQSNQGQLSWTLGEPFVGTLSSEAGSLAQGFLYLSSSTITSVRAPESAPEVRVFPNPATDRLTIAVPTLYTTYHVRVLDAVGREMISETVTGGAEKALNTSLYPGGAYYLQIRDSGNKTLKIFKILILK